MSCIIASCVPTSQHIQRTVVTGTSARRSLAAQLSQSTSARPTTRASAEAGMAGRAALAYARPRASWRESPVAVLSRKRRWESDGDGSRRTWSGSGQKGVDLSATDRRELSTPYSGLLRVAPRRLSDLNTRLAALAATTIEAEAHP